MLCNGFYGVWSVAFCCTSETLRAFNVLMISCGSVTLTQIRKYLVAFFITPTLFSLYRHFDISYMYSFLIPPKICQLLCHTTILKWQILLCCGYRSLWSKCHLCLKCANVLQIFWNTCFKGKTILIWNSDSHCCPGEKWQLLQGHM